MPDWKVFPPVLTGKVVDATGRLRVLTGKSRRKKSQGTKGLIGRQ